MKLIKCHIENFGKISDFTYDFTDGLNEICQDNGWGKSTLAGFIRVMLYGFDNEGKRDELENERRKFKPWQGGVYGGSLVFETDGKKYLAERTFGVKVSDDTFSLRNFETNMECHDFSSNLGEDIFKIDAASFKRTILISQNDCEVIVTDGIHAKMGNLVDATDDINNYDTVIKEFQKKLNEMTPSRKTGSIHKLKEQLAEKKNELRNIKDIRDSLGRIAALKNEQKGLLEKLASEMKSIADKQRALSEYMEKAAVKEEYVKLAAECNERKNALKKQEEFFVKGVPTRQEIEDVTAKKTALNTISEQRNEYRLTEEEQSELKRLQQRFRQYVPAKEDIADIYKTNDELKELEKKHSSIELSESDRDNYNREKEYFDSNYIDEAKISGYIRNFSIYQEKRAGLATKKYRLEDLQEKRRMEREQAAKNMMRSAMYIPILGLILIAAGICVFTVAPNIGPVVAGTGIIIFVIGILRYFGRKKNIRTMAEESYPIEEEIREDEKTIVEIGDSIRDFFEKMDIIYDEPTVQEQLYTLKNRYLDYVKLCARVEDAKACDRSHDIEEHIKKIRDFLIKFYDDSECSEDVFGALIHRLSDEAAAYNTLSKKEVRYRELAGKEDEIRNEIKNFKLKYDVSDDIGQVSSHFQEYLHCKSEYDRSESLINKFKENNDVDLLMALERPQGDDSLEELSQRAADIQEKLRQINKNILDYDKQSEGLTERLDELEELSDEIAEEEKQLTDEVKKYSLITKTKECMEAAKISFTAKYVEPVKSGFEKYYGMISTDDRVYNIDADSNITIYEAGMQRNSRFLSRGLKDLTGVCMRMALVDAMYREEKPFMIFDDPFVNLDAEKTEGGMRFLQDISADYQVIYFTCHPARTLL